jgi:hypothetical protein
MMKKLNIKKKIKKIKYCLTILSFLICIFITGCSFNNSLNEKIVISVVENRIEEDLSNKYYCSILNDLKITHDLNDVYSKELISYILNKCTFKVDKIENNVVTLNIKTKNIYDYLKEDSFLSEYIIKSNNFLDVNTTSNQYNEKLVSFLKEKINSNEVPVETIKFNLKFNYNEQNNTWNITDNSYSDLIEVVLCKNTEIENKIISKLEPFEFDKIEFIKNDIVEINPDIDKPLSLEYDKNNEKIYKYNEYLIPDDKEYLDIPNNNKTTRTSRRSAISIGETAVFDGKELQQTKFNYKANIMIESVLLNNNAKEFLIENNELIDNNSSYIIFKITIKLISNNTDNDKILFSFADFDLINFDNNTYPYVVLKNVETFSPISKNEITTGYIAFEYDNNELVNLAFKEFLPNTLWFEFN